jgi:SAM-dependent methyltransferase
MEWFEDREFWETLYPYMFTEERFADAAVQVEKLLALTVFQGQAVLDLCCGPGRHSVLLAQRGFAVTGVDRTEFLLEKARTRGAEANVTVEWVHEDMRHFVRPASFDLVINLFTSFGYFDNKDEDLQVLRNLHDSLRPGGALVIDVIGKERLAKVLQPAIVNEEADGALLIQRHEIFDDWTRVRNEWILVRDGIARTFRFHHTIYSGQELKDRLHASGFDSVRIYGDLDGAEYGPNARRLIAVAHKAL